MKRIWNVHRNHQLSKWQKSIKCLTVNKNIKKTNYIVFGTKKKLSHIKQFPLIKIDNENIVRTAETKFLGVIIDDKLNFRNYIDTVSLRISKSLGILSKVKYKLNKKCLLSLYYTLIYPHFNYCIIVWGNAGKTELNRLSILQKSIKCLTVNKNNKRIHSTTVKVILILSLENCIQILIFINNKFFYGIFKWAFRERGFNFIRYRRP